MEMQLFQAWLQTYWVRHSGIGPRNMFEQAPQALCCIEHLCLRWMVLHLGCSLYLPGELFKIPMLRPLPRPDELGSLGMGPRHRCLLKLQGWLQCSTQVEGHCFPSPEWEGLEVTPGVRCCLCLCFFPFSIRVTRWFSCTLKFDDHH